jgi:hypothetical protein
MSKAEMACYSKLLQSAKRVVEYGIGGSTVMTLEHTNIIALASVESDVDFIARVLSNQVVRCAQAEGRFKMHTVDIGPLKRWGYPRDHSAWIQWPRYPLAISRETLQAVDVVLIDGRFRVACALNAAQGMKPGGVICVHDYSRRHYKILDALLEPIEVVESMAFFYPPNNSPAFSDKLKHFFFDPR